MNQASHSTTLTLRHALPRDIPRIVEIWTMGFVSGFGAKLPDDLDYRAYFRAAISRQIAPFYYWVVEDTEGEVIAWVGLSPCRSNPVSRSSMAEVSAYVVPREAGSGVMSTALPEVFAEIDAMDALQHVVSFITADNEPSLRLSEHLGFERMGRLPASPNAPDAAPLCYLVRPCGPRPAARSAHRPPRARGTRSSLPVSP